MTDRKKKIIIINDILIPALHILYKEDYTNILWEVSERNICARLAHHMENIMRTCNQRSMFEHYFADVEYNRMQDEIKRYYDSEERRLRKMTSDLLIHKRGVMSNYLAVEMKNKWHPQFVESDKIRLKSMVTSKATGDWIHDTLVGAFITYSSDDVKIGLFEDVNGLGQEVSEISFVCLHHGVRFESLQKVE